MGVINFPGVENHTPDPFMEGYWEGLGDGFKLGEADARRGNVVGILFGAISGALMGSIITVILTIIFR